jgi:hypothetical protein
MYLHEILEGDGTKIVKKVQGFISRHEKSKWAKKLRKKYRGNSKIKQNFW